VIIYGLLLYLIRKHCKNEKLKNVLSAICLVFALLIGPSRLYVGVHWFTDVAAGMLFGLTVVAIYICILERIYNKNNRCKGGRN
jgi:undecaprenyl-diphosphatase